MPPDVKLARRYTRSGLPVGVESRADGKKVITGYAAVFYDPNDPGTEYRMYSDMVERIMPGAFDKAIRENDVRGLFNHEDCNILGRTKSGTMRLSVDKRGLKYEIDPPDTQCARDLMQSIDRGDVSGSSFMFRPIANTYRDVEGLYIVERNEVELFDVGPVCFPAYESTDTSVRSAADGEAVRREVESWLKTKRSVSTSAVKARAQAVAVAMAN
ncbi:MAG TPA: HK97 family phage prohead protease [Gemmata sp.]